MAVLYAPVVELCYAPVSAVCMSVCTYAAYDEQSEFPYTLFIPMQFKHIYYYVMLNRNYDLLRGGIAL